MKITNEMVEQWFSPEETLETFARELTSILNGEVSIDHMKLKIISSYCQSKYDSQNLLAS